MKAFITEEHKKQALASLKTLIRIPSVLDEEDAAKGQPFGKNIIAALEETLALCQRLGFKTYQDPEGYYGYAEVGAGNELFGILCHLDVVPAGDEKNWETAPFEPIVRDGVIIGRGTQDDKGPTIAALYAVRALMDAGVQFKTRIRFIFGTDEENLWRCVNKYNEKEEGITQGFTPDAEFPLIFAEKGLLQAYLTGPGTDEFTIEAKGALNVVPDTAPYSGKFLTEVKDVLRSLNFDFEDRGNAINVLGKSCHAKDAPTGINAITRLSMALAQVVDFAPLNFLGKLVKEDAIGENILGRIEDEQSGQLTMNIANLEINSEHTRIGLDIRIPVTYKKEEIVRKLSAKAQEYALTYEEFDYLDSLYVPLESTLVKNLLAVYREVTGDATEPMASGGATFARTMNQCVAFGAMFPDTPDHMHQPNERWELNSMYKAMQIYAEAIYRLCAKTNQ